MIFHKSCLANLEPLLRIYEGCARALVGELDDTNVIKLHRFSGKISYITYEGFATNPHPPLKERMKVSLRSLNIDWFDYSSWDDPYVLLRKHLYVSSTHPKYSLLKRMDASLRQNGLLVANEQIRKSELIGKLKTMRISLRGHSVIAGKHP